jgi:hypothetical protein
VIDKYHSQKRFCTRISRTGVALLMTFANHYTIRHATRIASTARPSVTCLQPTHAIKLPWSFWVMLVRYFGFYHGLQHLPHAVFLVVWRLAITGRRNGRILDTRHAPATAGPLQHCTVVQAIPERDSLVRPKPKLTSQRFESHALVASCL